MGRENIWMEREKLWVEREKIWVAREKDLGGESSVANHS